MLRPEWRPAIKTTVWRQPKDDVAVLVAQVYIILKNPSKLKRGKPITPDAMCGFYQHVTVPAKATDEEKATALERARAWLIDGFDKLYAGQQTFGITDETVPVKKIGSLVGKV